MKQFMLFNLLMLSAFWATAQKDPCANPSNRDGYQVLCEESITYKDSETKIDIHTSAKSTQEKGLATYKLVLGAELIVGSGKAKKDGNPKQHALAAKLEKMKLYVNNHPFTGYLKLGKPFKKGDYSGVLLDVYLFKDGMFQSIENKGDVNLATEKGKR